VTGHIVHIAVHSKHAILQKYRHKLVEYFHSISFHPTMPQSTTMEHMYSQHPKFSKMPPHASFHWTPRHAIQERLEKQVVQVEVVEVVEIH
jgi:hypothetical protein